MPIEVSKASAAVDVARAFFDSYNAHNLEAMLSACTGDAHLRYVPMGDQGQGNVHEVGRKIWAGLIDAFPDLHVNAESMFGDDRNAAAEVIIGGTQRKDFLQIRNQGKHYELPHAFLVKINGSGQISEITAYWDNASFYAQLGKRTID